MMLILSPFKEVSCTYSCRRGLLVNTLLVNVLRPLAPEDGGDGNSGHVFRILARYDNSDGSLSADFA